MLFTVFCKIKGMIAIMNKVLVNKLIFDEFVSGILNIIPTGIAAIILYGSVARGTAEADSDIDIAIIFNRPFTDKENDGLSDFIVEMDLKYDKVFSVIDVDNEDYKKWQNVVPFYRNVEREGIVLWKAA